MRSRRPVVGGVGGGGGTRSIHDGGVGLGCEILFWG